MSLKGKLQGVCHFVQTSKWHTQHMALLDDQQPGQQPHSKISTRLPWQVLLPAAQLDNHQNLSCRSRPKCLDTPWPFGDLSMTRLCCGAPIWK